MRVTGADLDSHSDSHSFNFELLFTILNFRLNITITFWLDRSRCDFNSEVQPEGFSARS